MTDYVVDDAVTHLGSSYIAIADNTSQSPPNAVFWEVLAVKGGIGAEGPQGPTGLPGLNGLNGATGPQGPQGSGGLNGLNGAAGTTGLQGLKGDSGDAGTQGIQGIQGVAGTNGASGTDGTDGTDGSPDTAVQVRSKFFSATCDGNDASDIMVRVGPLCVDKYEAVVVNSVGTKLGQWLGTGAPNDNYPCNDNGNDCSDTNVATNIFARSEAGVLPSADITWSRPVPIPASACPRMPSGRWPPPGRMTPDRTRQPLPAIFLALVRSIPVPRPDVPPTGARMTWWEIFGSGWPTGCRIIRTLMLAFTSSATYGSDIIVGVDEASPAVDRFPGALLRGGQWNSEASSGVLPTLVRRSRPLPSGFAAPGSVEI